MDVVDKLKAELCKFVSTKLGAKYADQLSIMKIVDRYNSHAGTVEGIPIDCLTIHNRLLVVKYSAGHYTPDDINRICDCVNSAITDNTTNVVCIPDDITISSMTEADFGHLMHRQIEMYERLNHRPTRTDNAWEFIDDLQIDASATMPRFPSIARGIQMGTIWGGSGYAPWRL